MSETQEIPVEETPKTEESTENLDEDIEALKRKVKEMEEEDEKLRKMQEELSSEDVSGGNKDDEDARSIYIGQVDYSTTAAELQQHFASCGSINRTTIFCDKFGQPKGFAYLEFADKDSVANAVLLNETLFKGRQIKVAPKRTNLPGMAARGRGRGGAGAFRPYFPRGRGGFRGRGRGMYNPYA
eukprot:TRINITY_DN5478_c0_g1_i1.p1 TRINITY_DN5478_c0_g1~~TRINITY_DN5478_c0_g1_i1.p1  ORF type:complete len:184 (+),score=84.30 TRINITY_DN5478_c0_g1_i1:63-614(+)